MSKQQVTEPVMIFPDTTIADLVGQLMMGMSRNRTGECDFDIPGLAANGNRFKLSFHVELSIDEMAKH